MKYQTKQINNVNITFPVNYETVQNYVNVLFNNLVTILQRHEVSSIIVTNYIKSINLIRSAGLNHNNSITLCGSIEKLLIPAR